MLEEEKFPGLPHSPLLSEGEGLKALVGAALTYDVDRVMFTLGGDFFIQRGGLLQRIEIQPFPEGLFPSREAFQRECLVEALHLFRTQGGKTPSWEGTWSLPLQLEVNEEPLSVLFRVEFFSAKEEIFVDVKIHREMPFSLEGLGFPPAVVDALRRIRWGLVLVISPPGGGKSTTARSLLLELASSRLAVTYEDPIETKLQGTRGIILQKQLGKDFFTWQELRREKKSPSSLILVENLTSREALEAVLDVASAGKTVIATAEGISVPMALINLESMLLPEERGLRRAQLSRVLQAAIYQKILPRKTPDRFNTVLCWEVLLVGKSTRNLLATGKYLQLLSVSEQSREFVPYLRTLENLRKNGVISEGVYREELNIYRSGR